ncbi:MAG: hypothetical protein QOI38_159 [Sphingomonadales bacterium]|jgi:tetratricopeptide (TPR) repeat protein|nr:hypothetical protein [Sphingomonadales bacterium]
MQLFRNLAIALSCVGAAAAAQREPPPPVVSITTPPSDRLRAAEAVLDGFDLERMLADAAYAATVADSLQVVLAEPGEETELRLNRRSFLAFALAAAGRHDEAEAAAGALVRMRPAEVASYEPGIFAARRARRYARMAELVAQAARAADRPEERSWLIAALSTEQVGWDLRELRSGGEAAPALYAEALLGIGWPGPEGSPLDADALRLVVIDRHIQRGDLAAAGRVAGEVKGVEAVLRLITARRYDPAQPGIDRLARLRAAIAEEDRVTAARLAAVPDDTARLVDRVVFLRSVGRDRDVLALLLPMMAEVRLVVDRHPEGLWLINEAAYSLIANGEIREGLELMRPLAAMDLEANPHLISPIINYVGTLSGLGRAEEALTHAQRIADVSQASDYGRMWIWSAAACSAIDLGRSAEAARWIGRMEEKAAANRAAMLQMQLCRGDFEAAERILVAALGSEEERDDAILWLQDYEPLPVALPAAAQRREQDFARLRARPAVQAALAAVGHQLRLPFPGTRYGWS